MNVVSSKMPHVCYDIGTGKVDLGRKNYAKFLFFLSQVIRMIIFMLFKLNHFHHLGFPSGSVVKNLLAWEDPLEEEMATYSSIIAVITSWTTEYSL